MKVAIIHDWLVTYAGAERVLEQLLVCFPNADVFSLVDFLSDTQRGFIGKRQVNTSVIQKMPFARKWYRYYFPLMPLAIEQMDLSSYDVIISNSHAFAKGVIVGPDQLHISYVNSPIRYAWDLQHEYLSQSGLNRGMLSWIVRLLLHKIRLWDSRTANGVDILVANSKFVARRIRKVYRRESAVVYPPVDVGAFSIKSKKDDYYVTASRLVPYKRVPTIIEAFSLMRNKRLIVIGDGPDLHRCKSIAGSSVEILGWQSDEVLREKIRSARAFIFAAEEDFGISPLEAQACGTPVIGYKRGGLAETIMGLDAVRPTGVFFEAQTPSAIASAVNEFESNIDSINFDDCRSNALRFAPERFRKEIVEIVECEFGKHVGQIRGKV